MRTICLLFILFIFPAFIHAQEPDDCHFLNIDCCNINIFSNTITLHASNQSTNIFSYPGFILFDNDMDTVAIETVNYYGIGNYFQPHSLNIVSPFTLPFDGYLELHTLFYGSYECSFPLSIADTTTVGIPDNAEMTTLSIYPNPASDIVSIDVGEYNNNQLFELRILNQLGQGIYSGPANQSTIQVQVGEFKPGFYSVMMTDKNDQIIATKKLIIK